MKLQKQVSRKINNKEYIKYVAVIPSKIIKQSGIREGTELKINVRNGKIIIMPKKEGIE